MGVILGQAGGQPEGAADARGAAQADLAAHQFGQFSIDLQAEPGAAVLAGRAAVGLGKGAEQLALNRGRNADAGIADFQAEHDLIAGLLRDVGAQGDRAALGKFDGVGGVVEQGLLQPCGVAAQAGRQLAVLDA